MNEFHMWLAFIGLGIVTLCTRSFFLLLGARFQLPASVQEYLKYRESHFTVLRRQFSQLIIFKIIT